ncbi:MAG: hypothetical protein QXH03_06245 [Candidatus Bathyarchaeia archaeon]
MRESSDYGIDIIFAHDEVKTHIENADEFIKTVQEFVKKKL